MIIRKLPEDCYSFLLSLRGLLCRTKQSLLGCFSRMLHLLWGFAMTNFFIIGDGRVFSHGAFCYS